LRQFVCLLGATVSGSAGIIKVVFCGFSLFYVEEKPQQTFYDDKYKFHHFCERGGLPVTEAADCDSIANP